MIFVQVAKLAVKKSDATTLKSLRGILCFFIVRADPEIINSKGLSERNSTVAQMMSL